ncbi:MAG: hypothetical protein JXR90_13425, partial [Spirochaetes bacterium]|nr:hypothetical protein [Spirochaetota bacterium]
TKEPPCTERYARWCERTVGKIITYLLLDSVLIQFPVELAGYESHDAEKVHDALTCRALVLKKALILL